MSRRGFTLIELLAGLLMLSALGLTLLAGERWLLLAVTRAERIFTARSRGHRVISFVEPRVLHAGLGLSSCRGAGALRQAFGDDAPMVANWSGSSPFIRVYKDTPIPMTPAEEENGVLRGTAFCALYARPSGLVLGTADGEALSLSPGGTARLDILVGDWASSGFYTGRSRNLRSWGTLPLSGMPFYLVSRTGRKVSLSFAGSMSLPVELSPVDELLSLQCERFCVRSGVFCFQGMETGWYPPDFYPREEGVLALWVEWEPSSRAFSLWVLASGGPAVFGWTGRPAEWPEDAPWQEGFGQHELYVSRASWRLENL